MGFNSKTFVADDGLTAAELNTYQRDSDLLLKISIDDAGNLSPPGDTELTISAGAVTPTQNSHSIDTESNDPTDVLTTITVAGDIRAGHLLYLRQNNINRATTVTEGGNIELANSEDCVLDAADRGLWLRLDAAGTTWREMTRVPIKGIVTMLSTPVSKLNVASSISTWTSWTTLDLGSDVPAGSLAAIVLVAPTDTNGAIVAVRKDSSDEQYSVSAPAGTVGEADADGHANASCFIVPVDANGDLEYRIGNANAGPDTCGMELWVVGRIDP